MKITGLDGKEHSWIPSNNTIDAKRSNNHFRAYLLLKEVFPNDRVLEELVLPGTKTALRTGLLRADFFIPLRGMLVEVHGSQHTEYNTFFYKNKMDFYRAKARDRDKKLWCELNNITLIELYESESLDEWRNKICQKTLSSTDSTPI